MTITQELDAATAATYTDQLRDSLAQAGVNLSPVTNHDGNGYLRFDAIQIYDDKVTLLWLGRPVYMVRRGAGYEQDLAHVRGEVPLNFVGLEGR